MKIGLIGPGHLGTAALQALLRGGHAAADILVCARTKEAANALAERYGVQVTTDAACPCTECDVVLLVVRKPALLEIAPRMAAVKNPALLISFLAGVTQTEHAALLPTYQIVRAIPSLSMALGRGVVGVAQDTLPSGAAGSLCAKILPLFGREIHVAEANLEKVTILGSSGLGFAAYVLDAFTRAGADMFGDAAIAEEIVRQIFADALCEPNFAETYKKVATPGGITERGILAMEEAALAAIFGKALRNALDKAEGRI